MIKNYFLTAFRSIGRNKVFSIINISGLAIGLSAAVIIFLIVQYQFNFDKFHKDRHEIYRVVTTMHFPDSEFPNSGTPLPLAPAIKTSIPEATIVAPFEMAGFNKIAANAVSNVLTVGPGSSIFADANYFKLFQYTWLAGNPASLNQPFNIVLTKNAARKYFQNKALPDIIGATLFYDDSIQVTVSGIVQDIKQNTDFTFDEFISYSTLANSGLRKSKSFDEWGSVSSSSQLFIKLNKASGISKIEKEIDALFAKRNSKNGLPCTFQLQPLNAIHFDATFGPFKSNNASKPTLYGLLVVAAFLLILGCINFINLSTAQSVQRAKEIGIRKTIGGTKKQLIFQFLSETLLLTITALLLSIAIMPWLLKLFSSFIPPAINMGMLLQPGIIIFIIALLIVVTLLAGFYPSLVLSSYKPVAVLKSQSNNNNKTRKSWFRVTLTAAQFIIAQFFVITTLAVSSQIHYMLNKDLGFRKDAVLTFDKPWRDTSKTRPLALLSDVQSLPGVAGVSYAGSPPATGGYSATTIKVNTGKKLVETTVEIKDAGPEYFKLYDMKLLAGRLLLQSDTIKEYLINETFANFLGFKNPADAVGKFVENGNSRFPIVGVLADFNPKSLRSSVPTLVYTAQAKNYSTYHVLLKPDISGNDWKKTIAALEKKYKSYFPSETFKYVFVDDSIAAFYQDEQNTSSLLNWAAGLTIFISCLGLLGLVIYTTNQRTKEIGIRKVLGASVHQLVALLSKDFLKIVLIACIIASPLAWWAVHNWLQGFAYKTDINAWLFIAGGSIMLLIALFTLSFQTIRSALANPVKSLRTE